MTIHQCPKCELRFGQRTELDYHCREEHRDFRHEYTSVPPDATERSRDREADPAK